MLVAAAAHVSNNTSSLSFLNERSIAFFSNFFPPFVRLIKKKNVYTSQRGIARKKKKEEENQLAVLLEKRKYKNKSCPIRFIGTTR